MKKSLSIFLLALGWSALSAQQDLSEFRGGRFALGVRTAYNYFPSKNAFRGLGAGGQFRISFSKKVNTEWFLDYINSNDRLSASRKDYHIGWAVQFAPFGGGFHTAKPRPYILGGQCFDLTKVSVGSLDMRGSGMGIQSTPLIFTAAAQIGAGLSYFAIPELEFNLQLQYMLHLGKDVEVDYTPTYVDGPPALNVFNRTSPEGHLLCTLSCSYYLFQLKTK